MKTPLLICLLLATTVPPLGAAAPGSLRPASVTPVRVIQTTNFKIPETFETQDHPWGEATVMINVDAQGQLVDLLVIQSTHDIYAQAAERALREWRYEPARENGRAVGTRQPVKLTFESPGVVVTTRPNTTINQLMRQSGAGIHSRVHLTAPQNLDTPLRAVNTVSPLPPAPESQAPGGATVTVDFIVDAQGRPRMPVVVNAPGGVYAESAVDALEQWRFTPPTQEGRPVAVRVQQQFVFEPTSS